MEGIIKVSPQLLTSTASEFSSQGSAISHLTQEMMNLITGMSATWEGEAASAYINKFKGLEDDIQRMVRMVQEHSSDLKEMAQVYAESDMNNAEEANSAGQSKGSQIPTIWRSSMIPAQYFIQATLQD